MKTHSVLLVSSLVTTAVCSTPSRFCPVTTNKHPGDITVRDSRCTPIYFAIYEKVTFTLTTTTCTDTCSGSLMGAWKCMASATSR